VFRTIEDGENTPLRKFAMKSSQLSRIADEFTEFVSRILLPDARLPEHRLLIRSTNLYAGLDSITPMGTVSEIGESDMVKFKNGSTQ
jgi:hypothetical protein